MDQPITRLKQWRMWMSLSSKCYGAQSNISAWGTALRVRKWQSRLIEKQLHTNIYKTMFYFKNNLNSTPQTWYKHKSINLNQSITRYILLLFLLLYLSKWLLIKVATQHQILNASVYECRKGHDYNIPGSVVALVRIRLIIYSNIAYDYTLQNKMWLKHILNNFYRLLLCLPYMYMYLHVTLKNTNMLKIWFKKFTTY